MTDILSPEPGAIHPAVIAPFFPHLEILDIIGVGGVSTVYRALQPDLEREVAIKVLHGLHASGDDAEQLRREARLLARLNHPNVVAVYLFGIIQEEAIPYFIMEYARGRNCYDLIEERWFDSHRATKILRELCCALTYAHRKGVLHLDIKPANLILSDEGQVKILDFGLATHRGSTGHGNGTAPYAAPERYREGHAVDERADIYSLGIVLYEMLTGHPPERGFRPPSELAGSHPRLDGIVYRCCLPHPEQRYASVVDLIADLDRVFRPVLLPRAS